jgi:hypothetical protein
LRIVMLLMSTIIHQSGDHCHRPRPALPSG